MDKTQIKTRHVSKEHLYFDRLVGLLQGEEDSEEDRQVGRNIVVLKKRVLSSFVFSIYCFMKRPSTRI